MDQYAKEIFIGASVVLLFIIGFFVFHVWLPTRAESRRLRKKIASLPKAGLIADSKLSAEFEERRLMTLNDSGVFGDWFFDDHENAISN